MPHHLFSSPPLPANISALPLPPPSPPQDNYGKSDEAAVAAVKGVYVELGLEAKFKQYEQDSYAQLVAAIEGQDLLPQVGAPPALAVSSGSSKRMAACSKQMAALGSV